MRSERAQGGGRGPQLGGDLSPPQAPSFSAWGLYGRACRGRNGEAMGFLQVTWKVSWM